MIREAVDAVRRELDEAGGLRITISVPGVREAARRDLQPHLGVEGGISILGTSGIVEPMSVQAIVGDHGPGAAAGRCRRGQAAGAHPRELRHGVPGPGGVALPPQVPGGPLLQLHQGRPWTEPERRGSPPSCWWATSASW